MFYSSRLWVTQLTENLISGREMEEELLMEDQQQEKQNESIEPKHLGTGLLCSGAKDTVLIKDVIKGLCDPQKTFSFQCSILQCENSWSSDTSVNHLYTIK